MIIVNADVGRYTEIDLNAKILAVGVGDPPSDSTATVITKEMLAGAETVALL